MVRRDHPGCEVTIHELTLLILTDIAKIHKKHLKGVTDISQEIFNARINRYSDSRG